MAWIPTTDEVRGAWKALVGNTKSFDAWLEGVKEDERERCTEVMDRKTGHYAQTHYAGKVCRTCDIFQEIYKDSK